MAKRTFGCSSIINAINLQFYLAGHDVYTDLKRAQGGMWLCEHAIKRVVTHCDCPEFRKHGYCSHITPRYPNTVTPLKRSWLDQAPRGLV